MSKWKTVKISDVCKSIFAGGDVPKNNYSIEKNEIFNIPIYTNGENNEGLYGYTTSARVTEPSITVSARGTIGFTAIRAVPFYPAIRLITLIPNNDIDIKYLYYVTQNYKFNNGGTSIPQLTVPMLKDYSFPLPPLKTQQQIAATLDKVTHIIDLCSAILEKLDLLVKARFVEMFKGIQNSPIFPYKKVKDFAEVVSGGTPDRKNNEYWSNGTIPWVKTTELQNTIINKTEEYISEKGLAESSAKIVPPHTILIAMYGQGKTRGMTGFLNIPASTNQACACILPSEKINSVYLWKYFMLSYNDLRNLAKGGNQPNLNGEIIKNYPVLFPPLELQNLFAAFVEQTDKTKQQVKQTLEQAETLKKALMQAYFG